MDWRTKRIDKHQKNCTLDTLECMYGRKQNITCWGHLKWTRKISDEYASDLETDLHGRQDQA